MEGNTVGSAVRDLNQSSNSTTGNNKNEFQSAVSGMMNTLIAFFTKNGSTDCEMFRSPEIYNIPTMVNLNTYTTGTAQQQQLNEA